MKLKKWILPAAIALLLLLIIPIPTGVLRDGGTKSYTALSYRIVDWNHLYGEGNIYDKTVIYPFPMNFMSIDTLLDQEAKNFKESAPDPATDPGDDAAAEPKTLEFSAQYARVGMFNEGISTPKTIRSLDELKEYYKTFDFSLWNQQEDAAVGLPEGWVGYDDAYFAERILVPVIQIESSGSFRHEATAARLTAQNDLVIEIDRVYPKEHVYTTDIGVWHIFVELDKSVVLAEEDQLIIYVDGIDSADPTVTASSSGRSASMSLSFPDGWEAAAADPSNDGSFGISFWPVGHPEGKLTLQYQKAFGVCGVGFTEKEITLGRHKAYQGSYDGKESWDFIRFVGTKDDYVVTNDGADVWWKEYGAEATEILGTAWFWGGFIDQSEVIMQATDLTERITATAVSGKAADDAFLRSQMRLSVDLFQASVLESREQNVLISPLSIQLALAMTANGADGKTRAEMEALLGGEIPLEVLNEYLYSYLNSLPSEEKCKLEIANSIWFRDEASGLTVKPDFLQTNANYYGAQAYKEAFDADTLKAINSWVAQHTDGMIDKILEQIAPDTMMYLINALAFDAEWERAYDPSAVYDGGFTTMSGERQTVEMMSSEESVYLDDGRAIGFVKPYKDEKYSFAALLPNEGVDIYDYIAGLTADGLQNTLNSAKSEQVIATLPKFSYAYGLRMNNVLASLGMPTAFDGGAADFSEIAENGSLYIGEVLHKAFISVDARGTKASAVTIVETKEGSARQDKVVVLDRPFVYMILDNATNLPVFLGVVTDVEKN